MARLLPAFLLFFSLALSHTVSAGKLPEQHNGKPSWKSSGKLPGSLTANRLPKCSSSVSNGFYHPGIYHDCSSLERMQAMYNLPNATSPFKTSLILSIARTTAMQNVSWTMLGPFASVDWAGADGHNIPLQNDGKAAYQLALGWFATGNPLWLSRVMTICMAWSSTLRVLNEQIQGGEGLAYMTAAAEILRASARDSGWTANHTSTYNAMIEAIVAPWSSSQGLTRTDFFMNQGFYGNGGAMNVAVFSENRSMYENMVYHASVGVNPIPEKDYAIPLQISGDAGYVGQVSEMGRDETHPMGSLRGLAFMGLTSKIQRGVDMYTQNNTRLLAGWEYWSTYNYNYTVPWEAAGHYYATVNETNRARNFATYGAQPLECIGVAYHEYFRRGLLGSMGNYTQYMRWQGIGWDTFEWGDVESVKELGF